MLWFRLAFPEKEYKRDIFITANTQNLTQRIIQKLKHACSSESEILEDSMLASAVRKHRWTLSALRWSKALKGFFVISGIKALLLTSQIWLRFRREPHQVLLFPVFLDVAPLRFALQFCFVFSFRSLGTPWRTVARRNFGCYGRQIRHARRLLSHAPRSCLHIF